MGPHREKFAGQAPHRHWRPYRRPGQTDRVESLTVAAGDVVSIPWRPERPEVHVTEHMVAALERIRPALVTVAQLETTTTYGALMEATGHPYLPQGLGPVLDVLSLDCKERGEPSLPALVVGAGGEVGDGFRPGPHEATGARTECYQHWRH